MYISLSSNPSHSNVQRSVTTYHCQHLIIDAGHIAISSELADKEVVRSVQSKRSYHDLAQHDKDLESLMYDKFALRLERAQVGVYSLCVFSWFLCLIQHDSL